MDMLEHALEGSEHNCKAEDSPDVQLTEGGHSLAEPLIVTKTDLQDAEYTEEGAMVAGGTLALDPTVQYQLRADTGQGPVTYRVVQVAQAEDGTQQLVAAGLGSGIQQAIVHSPFTQAESPTPDAMGDARLTYVPAVTASDIVGTEGIATATTTLGQVAATTGEPNQFYVMMSPQDVLQAGQRTIAPRAGVAPRIEGGRTTRDERRRATHNEVERRRRDKINNWIIQLSKLLPDCSLDVNKQGQIHSKGGILSKACDYIQDLCTANSRMAENLKETERLSVDAELLRQQCEELKQENAILRAQLQQHGIVLTDLSGGTA